MNEPVEHTGPAIRVPQKVPITTRNCRVYRRIYEVVLELCYNLTIAREGMRKPCGYWGKELNDHLRAPWPFSTKTGRTSLEQGL
jgi:hypothetical protein